MSSKPEYLEHWQTYYEKQKERLTRHIDRLKKARDETLAETDELIAATQTELDQATAMLEMLSCFESDRC